MRALTGFLIVLFALAIVSCSKDQEVGVYSLSYVFKDSVSGWTGDFADHPIDTTGYKLNLELDTLPYKINTDSTKKGIRVSGINLNDDLFMYIKRRVTGLRKNTTYELLFAVRVASNAAVGEAGLGGVLGDSVYLKVGASAYEPESQIVDGNYRINVDKGNLAEGGADMIPIGHVGVANKTVDYAILTRFSTNISSNFQATTNDEGELWLIVGTDSGYKVRTTLYYTQIDVVFNETE